MLGAVQTSQWMVGFPDGSSSLGTARIILSLMLMAAGPQLLRSGLLHSVAVDQVCLAW